MPKSKKETKKVTVIGRVEFVPNLDYQENCKYDKNGSLYCNVKFRIKNQKELDRYQIAIQGPALSLVHGNVQNWNGEWEKDPSIMLRKGDYFELTISKNSIVNNKFKAADMKKALNFHDFWLDDPEKITVRKTSLPPGIGSKTFEKDNKRPRG
jgi:hypothetical protein